MFKYKTPEEVGINSKDVIEYINYLEENRLSTHDIIIAKGNDIIFEKYWAPFKKDDTHRLYSSSKSIISIAVGFAIQDGLFSIDDKIVDYFKDDIPSWQKAFDNQTIKDMLIMSNSKPLRSWFNEKPIDRVKFYFENDKDEIRDPGCIFEYASEGTFILTALIERLTNMSIIDYLRIKLFDIIGVSNTIKCLKCPGGHSWGDSAFLCTPIDFLKIARFVLNYGVWDGKQILNKEYLIEATSKHIDNNLIDIVSHETFGYGYFFWRTYDNSFFMSGMGCQFAVCNPENDLIIIYNGDNQGNQFASDRIILGFFDKISRRMNNNPLPMPNNEITKELNKERILIAANGNNHSKMEELINGKTFTLYDNPMQIKWIKIIFDNDDGKLIYTNEQGYKELSFGLCNNVITKSPEEGYAKEIGTEFAPGNYYRCACSGAWVSDNTFFIKVQIIDDYFGRLNITISFKDENNLTLTMKKTAEDFLNTYSGWAKGKSNDKQ